ncbi:MAG: hypothetical protein WCJ66_04525 [Verrucomicrobiota bacterium]
MTDELTVEQKEKLMEILETWDSAHRAIRVINCLGRVIRWLLGIGSAVAIIWGVWNGSSPK